MPKAQVVVYDLDMNKVAYLENATTVGYEQPMNALWTASFTLPADDPKNDECHSRYFVELFEGDERLDLFRIMPTTARRSNDGQTITYSCEHVLATMIDDVLFQYHTIGGLGVYTTNVINYILQQQEVERWVIGDIQFAHQFEYNWENENILNALRSIPSPFIEEYMWTWDTSSYPWTLNLVEPTQAVDTYIRYAVNLRGVEKNVDPRGLCTRLYGLGYGEGVNQLDFKDINSGLPYIDADTQVQFGIVSDIFVDRRFESSETLKARCEAILAERKIPRISYSVDAAELYAITDDPIHKFTSGTNVRVIDEELGIDVIARVVSKRKQDVRGHPGDVQLEISNKPIDIAGLFNEMETKQRINDLYAQGATNWDSHDFADNCDPTHPAILKFFVPADTARINKVTLSYESEAFRAYEKGVASAPANTSGASSASTTESGGATTSGPSSINTTASGGGATNYFGSAGGVDFGSPLSELKSFIYSDGLHNHGIPDGTQLSKVGGGSETFLQSGLHYHLIYDFYLTTPSHVHNMDHTHTIGSHVHDMPHTHVIPAHTHATEYGIFEGSTPTTIVLEVDGSVVSGVGVSEDSVDLINYLSKDGEGKIQRGSWHTIEITPNSLGRVVASVQVQLFVNSRGGGDY